MSSSDDEYDPAAAPPLKQPPRSEVQRSADVTGASLPGVSGPTVSSAGLGNSRFECLEGTRVVRLSAHRGLVRAVSINAAGNSLVTAGNDGTVTMWEFSDVANRFDWVSAARGKISGLSATRSIQPFTGATLAQKQAVAAVAWLANDSHFVACEDGPQPLLIRRDGKTLQQCVMGFKAADPAASNGHRVNVTCCAAHPSNGDIFATGATDGTVRAWRVERMAQGSVYAARHGSGSLAEAFSVNDVAWFDLPAASNEPLLSGCGSDGVVQLWSTSGRYVPGRSAITLGAAASPSSARRAQALRAIAVSWDSNAVAVRYSDASLRFFDVRAGAGESWPRLEGFTLAGDCAPLLSFGESMLATSSMSSLADLSGSGCLAGTGSYVVRITKGPDGAPRVSSAHLVVADAHVTAAAVHGKTQQLFVGDNSGGVHALMCPTGSAAASDVSWLLHLRMHRAGKVRGDGVAQDNSDGDS